MSDEKNLSAKQALPQTKTRIFGPKPDCRWAFCIKEKTPERAEAVVRSVGLATKKLGFSKTKRLKTPEDFRAVFNQPFPLRLKSHYFTILARPNQRENARLGVIVAKRVIKKATGRNLVRRLVKESFRLHQSTLVGLDIVVMLRGNLLEQQSHSFLFNGLSKQWKELVGLWKKR